MKRIANWKIFWTFVRESILVTSLVALFVVVLTGVMVYQAREIPKEWWILTSGVVTYWFTKKPVQTTKAAIEESRCGLITPNLD